MPVRRTAAGGHPTAGGRPAVDRRTVAVRRVAGGRAGAEGVGGRGRRARATSSRTVLLAIALMITALVAGGGQVVAAAAEPSAGPGATSGSSSGASVGSGTGAGGLGLPAATALVRANGYTPTDTDGYDPGRTLSVIIGVLSSSADGHPQRAFFFNHGRYVGPDSPQPSAVVSWIWSTDDTVALQYQLYSAADPMCCPTAGAATVRFHWSGSALQPMDKLPINAYEASGSRR